MKQGVRMALLMVIFSLVFCMISSNVTSNNVEAKQKQTNVKNDKLGKGKNKKTKKAVEGKVDSSSSETSTAEGEYRKIGIIEKQVNTVWYIVKGMFARANWMYRILYVFGAVLILILVLMGFFAWHVARKVLYVLSCCILGLSIYEIFTIGFSWCLLIVAAIFLVLVIISSVFVVSIEEDEGNYGNPILVCIGTFLKGAAYCIAVMSGLWLIIGIFMLVAAMRDDDVIHPLDW